MDQDDTAELVEVVDWKPNGRIAKYIKTKITRNEAISLRANARVEDMRTEALDLVRDTNAFIERSKAYREPDPPTPPQRRALPAPQPTPQLVPRIIAE
jgi:hypothetical protein